jgi:hypothetical protein
MVSTKEEKSALADVQEQDLDPDQQTTRKLDSAPLVPSPSAKLSAPPNSAKKTNPLMGVVLYLKNSFVRAADGGKEMISNYGECNRIRRKQQEFRAALRQQWLDDERITERPNVIKDRVSRIQGGINYEEYMFLQKGKDDRSKMLNLLFLSVAAPRYLPYLLMFNGNDMLPSPFHSFPEQRPKANKSASSSSWTEADMTSSVSLQARTSRERTAIVVETLLALEREVLQTLMPNKGPFSFLTGGGANKLDVKAERLRGIHRIATQSLSDTLAPTDDMEDERFDESNESFSGARQLLSALDSQLYQSTGDFTRAEKRLCTVPSCLTKGIGRIISASASLGNPTASGAGGGSTGGFGGIVDMLTPNIVRRSKVLGHLRKIEEADDFLTNPWTSIRKPDGSTVIVNMNDGSGDPSTDLVDSLNRRALREACRDRFIVIPPSVPTLWNGEQGGKSFGFPSRNGRGQSPSPISSATVQGPSEDELRQHLRDWLRLAVHEPAARMADAAVVPTPPATRSTKEANGSAEDAGGLFFNANLARFALLGYYGCWSARQNIENSVSPDGSLSPAATLVLPRLFFSTP